MPHLEVVSLLTHQNCFLQSPGQPPAHSTHRKGCEAQDRWVSAQKPQLAHAWDTERRQGSSEVNSSCTSNLRSSRTESVLQPTHRRFPVHRSPWQSHIPQASRLGLLHTVGYTGEVSKRKQVFAIKCPKDSQRSHPMCLEVLWTDSHSELNKNP